MLTPSELYIALRDMLKFTDSDSKIGIVDRPYYMHGKGDLDKDFFISAPCNDADLGSEDFIKAGNLDVISSLEKMFTNELLGQKINEQHGVNIIIPMAECRSYGIQRSHYVFLSLQIDSRECRFNLYDPKPFVSRIAYDISPVISEAAVNTIKFFEESYKRVAAYVNEEPYIAPVVLTDEQKYKSPMDKIELYFESKGFKAKFETKCLGTQAITDNYSCGEFIYNYICALVLASRSPESLSLEEVQGAYSLPSKPLKPNFLRGNSYDSFIDEVGETIEEKKSIEMPSTKWQEKIIAENELQRSKNSSSDLF